MLHVALPLVTFTPMLLEAVLSRRNERRLRSRGAIEPRRDVYPIMQVAYPASFLAMLAEGWHTPASPRWMMAGATVFVAGKAIKYWAIATLGPLWSFRVLVVPGEPLVTHGPYRWLRHPNYLGVLGELAGVALMARAPVAGAVAIAGFAGLLRARIAVEERALESSGR